MKFSLLLVGDGVWGKFRFESQGKAGNLRLGILGGTGQGAWRTAFQVEGEKVLMLEMRPVWQGSKDKCAGGMGWW